VTVTRVEMRAFVSHPDQGIKSPYVRTQMMLEIQFPVVNSKGPLWTVTPEMMMDWQQDFPHLDIEKEVRKARAWCVANVQKRKTARGMPKFLVGWFMRAEGTGTMERRVQQRRDIPKADVFTWVCPHTPHCPHRAACAIVALRKPVSA
jgi:hypothetical protein